MGDVELSPRMFAAGQEPLGERVNVYQEFDIIRQITNALKDDEIAFMRESPLGKLLDIPTKPAWSGSFGLFLLSRQLDVVKENGIWVLFGRTPVRFSLREFKIVTGLSCGKYPVAEKKKRKGTAGIKTPYYGKLFGLEEDVTIERIIYNLKKRLIGVREMRIRYACLALVDGILLPTSHYPKVKINKDHAEIIENMESFLAYPWGRLSFDKMMTSIKERELSQLTTSSVTVQGLFLALQMVVLQAAPAIQEGPAQISREGSGSDDDFLQETQQRPTLKLNHAWELDASCKVNG